MGIGKKLCGCLLSIILVVPLAVPVFAAKTGTMGVADLPAAAQMAFSEAMGRNDAAYHADRVHDGYRLKNRELIARFDADGASVEGWRLAIVGIGRGGELLTLPPAIPEVKANRIEYRRGDVTEWYVNGPLGLEQGFTLERSLGVKAAGTLALTVALPKEMQAVSEGDRTTVLLKARDNSRSISYGRLAAWDAAGKTLPAWFEIAGSTTNQTLQIRVDERDARYPIVIDPLIEQVQLTASDPAADDRFGYAVALNGDGNTALVGAYKNSNQGAAYVFTWSGTTWSQQQKLIADDGAANDYFGYSVSLSSDGNTALIGAQGKDLVAGAAYVFTRSGTTWSQQQKLTPTDPAANDYFGFAVALSSDGDTALIGAKGKNSSEGAAYAFTRSGTTWSQQQKLIASDHFANDLFGYSVAMGNYGNTALIGASGKNSFAGATYAFTRNGATWSEQQKLLPADGVASDRFGISVALARDGNTALIGASTKNSLKGSAYAFTRSVTTWSEQQQLTAADAAANDFFGYSVALSSDGNSALIGAYGRNSNTGTAYIFSRSDTTWSEQRKLDSPDVAANNYFGYSVAIGGTVNTVLCGAYGKNSLAGAAHVILSFGLCSAGNFYNGVACAPCEVGTYQAAGINRSCVAAPIGTYVVTPGASAPTPCAAGKYQNSTAQMVCIDCAPGKYQPATGQSSCLDAPAGTYVSDPGSAAATPCAAGKYQSSTGQTTCISCPAGSYQNFTGQSSCIPAPVGTIVSSSGSSSATPCPPGTSQSITGLTTCLNCPRGAYQNASGQTSCIDAPAGTYVISPASASFAPCAAGYYQGLSGQWVCNACPPGKYQPAPGQSSCVDAPAGFYIAAAGATSATPCDAGTYQSATGQTSCNHCPANTLQPATGQSSCLAIPKAATTIAADPVSAVTLYAGIDTAGIYRSIDSGVNWTAATTQPTNLRVKALVLKPGDSTKQFVATYGGGIFKSINSGVDWSACATQPTNLNLVSLTIDGSGKLYAGTEAGVFVSSDGCGTWTEINSGLP